MQIVRPLIAAAALCGSVCGVSQAAENVSDPGAWRRLAMDRALEASEEISDPYRLAQALANISRAQVSIDDSRGADASIRRALQAAERIPEAEFKGWALHDIVLAQIAADDQIGARQTADQISAERPQSAALAAIADLQLRSGRLSNAQTTAARIRDDGSAGGILRQIATMQVRAGDLAAARETARRIDDDFYQALALGDIAVAEIRAGSSERAKATAARAHRSERGQVEGRIAFALVEKGDIRGAIEIINKIDDPLYRSLVQARLANLRASAGNTAEAQELFAAASSSIESARERGYRFPVTLSQLARFQTVSGNIEGARESLRRAIAATAPLQNERQRDDALDVIARSQMRLGDNDPALVTALQINDRVSKALLVRDVIATRARSGASIEQLRAPVVVQDPLTETAALFGILGAQLLKTDKSGASATIDAARTAVRAIPDTQMKPAAFAALAAARVRVGEESGGWEMFQEALASADAIERPDQKAAAYVRIVNAVNDRLLFLGQPEKTGDESQEK